MTTRGVHPQQVAQDVRAIGDGQRTVREFDTEQLGRMRSEARQSVALALLRVDDDADGLPYVRAASLENPYVRDTLAQNVEVVVAIENERTRRLRQEHQDWSERRRGQ